MHWAFFFLLCLPFLFVSLPRNINTPVVGTAPELFLMLFVRQFFA